MRSLEGMRFFFIQNVRSVPGIVAVCIYFYGAAAFFGLATAWAQTDPLQIHATEVKAIEIHRQIQQREDRWADEKSELQTRYQHLQAEEAALAREKAALESRVEAMAARQREAERKIVEATRIGENLQAHLESVVARLEEAIAGDLPFLSAERARRIDEIKKVLVQPETSIAEKCRRVMEALKVEAEYGHTVEVYQEVIEIDGLKLGQPVMADILRVGRLALFWRTPDGGTVGHWDRLTGKWVPLPGASRRHINDATEMALRQRTVDMVKLPLGRIAVQ
ncbi:DUF3450 domain-containing protein [uncultured Desulfosarcina sp.]|uniref:DUF3450 domain-containing protein n=1 Tax=uncultured Desulfosarcina sp. TaxID=218289 RepID=UPI0029C87B08|nr:DUF3450 domain-containing protein [uncultured Desulfosarcina sp.]